MLPQPDTFAVAVYEAGALVWHSGGLRSLELGRQITTETRDEPGKYGLAHSVEPLRLVIADSSERRISRQHLRLESVDAVALIARMPTTRRGIRTYVNGNRRKSLCLVLESWSARLMRQARAMMGWPSRTAAELIL